MAKEIDCELCKRIIGEDSQFIKVEDYHKLIDTIIDFPDGDKYFVRPKLIYIDEVEAEDGYYSTGIKYFGLKIREKYIRGLEIISDDLTPGFVRLLWRYGFALDSVDFGDSKVYNFEHISFV